MDNGNMFATKLEAAMPTETYSHCCLAVLSVDSLPDYTTGRLKQDSYLNTVKIFLHNLMPENCVVLTEVGFNAL
jgi:hypothetical protein